MRSLGVICARGSSKRLRGKNIKPLNGVPLIGYMCQAALASRIDRVILSTEDDGIAAIAQQYGVEAPFRRPTELAADYATSPDIVGHALDWVERQEGKAYEVLVLLQPTTPFVLPVHIDACLHAVTKKDGMASCFTARKVTEPPQWMFTLNDDGTARPLLGRAIEGEQEHSQKLSPCYFPTGAAYAVRVDALRKQKRIICDPASIVEMDLERSVDIDEPLDWLIAESIGRFYGFAPAVPARNNRSD